MSSSARFLALTLLLSAASTTSAGPAYADGALGPADDGAPTSLDLQIGVAVTPFGQTRWSRIRVEGTSRVMWLVPARPGATLDWAPDAWLDALEDSTAPRITPPDNAPPCAMPSGTDRVPAFAQAGASKLPTDLLVHTTESGARAHIAARGFGVSPVEASRIAALYARGERLVSVELDVPAVGTTSRTLRVSDDGGTTLPLALTGSGRAAARITAFVIAGSAVSVPSMLEVDTTNLMWGMTKSSYAADRATLLTSRGGLAWVREAATNKALFEGFSVPALTSSAADTYFRGTAGPAWLSCSSVVHAKSSSMAVVGRTCAPGALGSVPGGAACTPSAGDLDPAQFACSGGIDLALAMAGQVPLTTVVTRLAGLVPEKSSLDGVALSADATPKSPVARAAYYETCTASAPPTPYPQAPEPDPEPETDPGPDVVVVEGCSGSATTTTSTDESGTYDETTTSSSGCSGDTTTTSDSSESGSESDTCSGDSSTSSSSDSDSDSSDEGWDTEDSSSSSSSDDSCASESKAAAHAAKTKGGKSKVSRYAMLLAFLVLPFRRRMRKFR